jgi:hypothetical protein
MTYEEINKLMEIQYLKGRLDELYKGYVPHNKSTDNRIVDSRISKYEDKLKSIDEISYYLYQIERENQRFSKRKGKAKVSTLLSTIKDRLVELNDDTLIGQIEEQINSYK